MPNRPGIPGTKTWIMLLALAAARALTGQPAPQIQFPRPFAVVVDDLGWMHGGSQDPANGPYRIGFKRDMVAQDYLPMIQIGQAVGVRIQGVFVLGELDRENAVAKLPSATREGSKWDNTANVSPEQLRIMETVKAQSAFLEFGLHGVGHEYWENGRRRRAEWYNLQDKRPWTEAEIRAHLDMFRTIMAQYGLSKENGHSFPESFVPTAYSYFWNPSAKPYSLGKILREYGVRYANTAFSEIPQLHPPAQGSGGFDNGVLVLDRHNFGNEWWEPATLPRQPISAFDTDIIETHWVNLLATDDIFQASVNAKWIALLQAVQAEEGRYLAKNTEQLYSQWLYKRHCKVSEPEPGRVLIDARPMPQDAFDAGMVGPLVLKVRLPKGTHLSRATLDGQPIPSIQEVQGFAHLYLPAIPRGIAELRYGFGDHLPELTVINDGTYLVYARALSGTSARFKMRVYGEQAVAITTASRPSSVTCSNPRLSVREVRFNRESGMTTVVLQAHDIQGETGELILGF
ncbi:MAG: hypothetical protein HXX12_13050 [Geothrix sp.]|uniref:hypothetical protein n=1 Tax=Geothrix sp. TaxID=1962974 RepID=UPI0018003076|nr:hypothetical protein [Geothrix sp.]NWJ41884.1 hypothetical protein [Geothrix sp.]WIL20143.1 MAG: hypothetical protein QOZ81_002689 [Geothrix sp.]